MTPTRLAECMAALGWTNSWLAAQAGYAESSVRQWLSGRAAVPADVAAWVERRADYAALTPPPAREPAQRGRPRRKCA